MREIVIATKNQGKLREIRELFQDLDVKVTSLEDDPGCPQIVEDGKTFKDNAVKKALAAGRLTGKIVIGEDSGLEVMALGNRPGIYSSRFSGPGATDDKNNAKLLKLLKGKELAQRRARYRCCVALARGEDLLAVVQGSCSGLIALEGRGKNGFGYDPVFYLPRYGKTFGELDRSIKLRISHRARAFKKLKGILKKILKKKNDYTD